MSDVNEMNAGGVPGVQVPMGIKQRKDKVDELMKQHPDVGPGAVLAFFGGMSDQDAEKHGKDLDSGNFNAVADEIRKHVARQMVQKKVKEVVRKKAGGGGYVLYSPNQGKKKDPKPAGHFPTKLAAKRAELARFPPKDPGKLGRLRKEIDRLMKDPKKRAEKEKKAEKEKPSKKEALDLTLTEAAKIQTEGMHRKILSRIIAESLFQEERTGSEWDEYISKLSNNVLGADKKFQKLQKNIDDKTGKVLQDAFGSIKKALGKEVKLKDLGVKKHDEKGKSYLPFAASMDNVEVGPIFIYVDGGVPQLEISDQAKVALTKVDPSNAKLFRAELVTVQERVLDRMEDLVAAIKARDTYLTKVQDEVDKFVAGLSPLQVSLLKQLLVKKYRKIS